jgi:hypothetical protein
MQRPVSSRFQALVIACFTKKTRYGCGVGAVGAWLGHSSTSVGEKMAGDGSQPVCKGDWGGGGENPVHIFHAKTRPPACSQWNGEPNGPTFLLQRFRALVDDEKAPSVYSAGDSSTPRPTPPPASFNPPRDEIRTSLGAHHGLPSA